MSGPVSAVRGVEGVRALERDGPRWIDEVDLTCDRGFDKIQVIIGSKKPLAVFMAEVVPMRSLLTTLPLFCGGDGNSANVKNHSRFESDPIPSPKAHLQLSQLIASHKAESSLPPQIDPTCSHKALTHPKSQPPFHNPFLYNPMKRSCTHPKRNTSAIFSRS